MAAEALAADAVAVLAGKILCAGLMVTGDLAVSVEQVVFADYFALVVVEKLVQVALSALVELVVEE